MKNPTNEHNPNASIAAAGTLKEGGLHSADKRNPELFYFGNPVQKREKESEKPEPCASDANPG